jgi:hypothetical protein
MQLATSKLDPYDNKAGTGVLGRAKDVLSRRGHVVNAISIDGPSITVEGVKGKSYPSTIVGRAGSKLFASRPKDESYFDIENYAHIFNQETDGLSGIFGETWSQQFTTGIEQAKKFETYFEAANLDDSIWMKNDEPNYHNLLEQEHWEKWSTISKLIQRKDLRNSDRDLFFTTLGSWGTCF